MTKNVILQGLPLKIRKLHQGWGGVSESSDVDIPPNFSNEIAYKLYIGIVLYFIFNSFD